MPRPTVVRNCRHCQQLKSVAARGLCNGCYKRVDIRTQYASTVSQYPAWAEYFARRASAHISKVEQETEYEPPLDPEGPTTTLVGSEERMLVYADRFQRGVAIFHPDDSVILDDVDGGAIVFTSY